MIGLSLPSGRLRVACVGAHPDDVEIGCGGTLLRLAAERELSAHWLVLTGTAGRAEEARVAANRIVPGAHVMVGGLRDGRLPASWDAVKDAIEELAARSRADVVLAPRTDDAHQDHRLVGELVPTAFRDALVLHYEIPKWDGDLGRANVYVDVPADVAQQKLHLLDSSFGSQTSRDWWDPETFLGLMRLRGIESRTRYAEAFVATKAVLAW